MSLPESVARNILQEHWDGFLPVDINALASSLSVVVVYSGDLPDTVVGSYSQADGRHTCAVNTNQSPARQRFVLAHELGHFALMHDERTDCEEIFRRQEGGGLSPFEAEANAFAEEILMPSQVVRHLIMGENITAPDALARRFDVTTRAMVIRLMNLGWIK